MRIILNEVKKIFTLKKILILLMGSFIIYNLYISFWIENFPNGRPEGDSYRISSKMIEDYGNNMNDKEFEDFKKLYLEKIEEATKYLQSREDFRQEGILTYDDYKNMDTRNNEKHNKLESSVVFEEGVDVFWELQEIEGIIERYEEINDQINIEKIDQKDILPWFVCENYNTFIEGVLLLVIVSIIFVILPVFFKDKQTKVNYLQYTSKTGRNIFKYKVIASLISAFLVVTIELIILFLIYSTNNISQFLNSNINSFYNMHKYWYSITFIQYITITIILIYIVSFSISLLSIVISNKVSNYISAIGAEIIVGGLIIGITKIQGIFSRFGVTYMPKFISPLFYIVLVTSSIILAYKTMKKELVKDMV